MLPASINSHSTRRPAKMNCLKTLFLAAAAAAALLLLGAEATPEVNQCSITGGLRDLDCQGFYLCPDQGETPQFIDGDCKPGEKYNYVTQACEEGYVCPEH